MIIFHFDLQPQFKYMNYFICTSHHFTPHGINELNKLTLLPMCGFIAQLVEHPTGIAEVTSSSPVEALILSGFFFPIGMIILHFVFYLLPSSMHSLWDAMKKLKLNTFSNWKVRLGDKVIKLREVAQSLCQDSRKPSTVSTRWQWCRIPYARLMALQSQPDAFDRGSQPTAKKKKHQQQQEIYIEYCY